MGLIERVKNKISSESEDEQLFEVGEIYYNGDALGHFMVDEIPEEGDVLVVRYESDNTQQLAMDRGLYRHKISSGTITKETTKVAEVELKLGAPDEG